MGATVLHDESIFPVRKEGIPINIRNTNKPEDPGTMIVESTSRKPEYVITGIAGKKGFTVVSIEKDMMNSEIGFGRKVLEVFEKQGLSFEHTPSGIDTMSIVIHQDEFVEKEQEVLAGLSSAKGLLKKEISRQVKVRHIPELIFRADHSMDYGRHIDEILDNIDFDSYQKDTEE